MADDVDISIVIPAYDEQVRIGLTLVRTLDYLRVRHPRAEVIVVDDGSRDSTVQIVRGIAASDPRVRVLEQPRNLGKGAAVRRGVLDARGALILFMDADLATPIEELDTLQMWAAEGYDVVIGSRALPDSDIRAHQPAAREMMGRVFNVLVRTALLGGIKDTQCGFKLFRRAAGRELFSRQQLDGFAFDVEVLLLARDLGYRVREVPVVWYHAPNSKVSPISDAKKMLTDIVKLRLARLAGKMRP